MRHPTFIPYTGQFYFALYATGTTENRPTGPLLASRTLQTLHFANSDVSFDASTRHEFMLSSPVDISAGTWWLAFSSSTNLTIYSEESLLQLYSGAYPSPPSNGDQLGYVVLKVHTIV